MKPKSSFFFIVFWLIALADMAVVVTSHNQWRWFTKPLLMPLLVLGLYCGLKPTYSRLLPVFLALVLSWAGDVFLQMEGFFIPGLASFLIAHIAYIYYFLNIKSDKKGIVQHQPWMIGVVLLYVIGFLWLLFPHLGALKIPVMLYAFTIGTMLLAAVNTRYKLSDTTSQYFIRGAISFVLSDSLLAYNLFVSKYLVLSFLIMLTYCAAQYWIVRGVLSQDKVG